ncbi:uncharacterized protein LOC114932009 [Nylanderia fulva]|uniref:uncharacterized protein LOC114932009 n=1 Tax=Nylanderia fulva TaxID=613905 RepID=UPI0010FB2E0B|nr:uncharacterized protein LOC114932009 [Nylanderia fulva]
MWKKSSLVTRHYIRSTENRKCILWTAMHLHSQLYRIARDINDLFKMQMTVQTMSYFITLTTMFYYQYHIILCVLYNNNIVYWKFFLCTSIWCVFDLIRLISFNCICESVSAKAQKTEGIIQKLTNIICFVRAREEICQFVLQILLRPLKFSGMGLFHYGHKFLYKSLVWIISVIIIIIQMDKIPTYQTKSISNTTCYEFY